MVASELFLETDEVLVAEINTTNISTSAIGKQYCVLSNKRLYHKGKTVINSVGGAMQDSENTVNLKEVTCSGFFIVRNYLLLVMGFLFILGGLFVYFNTEEPVFVLMGILVGVIFLILFRVKQLRVIKVFFGGGCLAFSVLSASEDQMRDFNRRIQYIAGLAKDGKNIAA